MLSKNILLVEDEDITAIITKKNLKSYGYSVLHVNSGEKAIEMIVGDSCPDIDIILMDINLGSGLTGPQTAQIILKNCDIPLIFLSSHLEKDIVEATEKITSYGYVMKNSGITVLDISIKMAFRLFETKQLLETTLKEVHHRIKNNMNIIISLLSLQISASTNKEVITALEETSGRILSMAILYDKLYNNNSYNSLSIKDYLDSVLEEFEKSFQIGDNLEIIKDIEDIELETKKIQILGIIINELLSNIIKYAFNNSDKKIIAIMIKRIGTNILIEIQDNGKGIPEGITFENSTGFGLSLINNLVVGQLKGTVKLEREQGTKVTIVLPL